MKAVLTAAALVALMSSTAVAQTSPAKKDGAAENTAVNTSQSLSERISRATVGSAAARNERGGSDYERPYYETSSGEGVFDRKRPDFEPPAMRARSFTISPAITFGSHYNSNIFSTEQNAIDDLILTVNPALRIESDWNKHELNLRAAAKSAAYKSNTDQDWTDGLLSATGALDIVEGFYLSGGLTWQRLHEERGFPNTAALSSTAGPTVYDQTNANVGVTRKMGQVGVDLDYDAVRYSYRNNESFRQDDRDRTDNIGTVRLGYEFIRGYELFARGKLSNRDYNEARDDAGWARSGDGYEAVLGTSFRLTGTLTGDAYIGQAQSTFDDRRFEDVDAVVYGSSLLWTMTDLTSLRLNSSRSINDSVTPSVSSYVESAQKIALEHELLRNVLLGASFEYRRYDYEGFNVDRVDNLYETGFGGKYLVGRHVAVGLEYIYRHRNSTAAFQDYQQNNVLANVAFRY